VADPYRRSDDARIPYGFNEVGGKPTLRSRLSIWTLTSFSTAFFAFLGLGVAWLEINNLRSKLDDSAEIRAGIESNLRDRLNELETGSRNVNERLSSSIELNRSQADAI